MDPTGCPPGFVTDRVLYGRASETCNIQIGGYIAFVAILFSLRAVTAAIHVLDWRRRQANAKVKQSRLLPGKKFKQRLPIVPGLSVIFTIVYGSFCLLVGLNVVNAENGGSAFIFGIGWTLFGLMSLFFLTKFISLGYRIVPRAKSQRFETISGVDKLSRFTAWGRFGLFLLVILLAGQFTLLCVVSFLYNADDRYVRAAFGLQAAFVGLQGFSALGHLERVKQV